MFSNKHVVVAILVAPVLAIMAWFAVDYVVSERPHAARPGDTYPLIAKSNCRYDSGQCDLKNGDFELSLRSIDVAAEAVAVELRSRFPLQQATIGYIDERAAALPTRMKSTDPGATLWSGALALPSSDASTIGIAVTAQGATYYAEIPAVFLDASRKAAGSDSGANESAARR